MPLISFEAMRKDAMSIVRIKVISAFVYEQKVAEVGDILTVTKHFAHEMIHGNKAVRVIGEDAPPVKRPEPAPLATQTVPVETPEGGSGGRRTKT